MITVLIPKNITAVINFITVIELIPLNYKTVTVTVILINSGNFQDRRDTEKRSRTCPPEENYNCDYHITILQLIPGNIITVTATVTVMLINSEK